MIELGSEIGMNPAVMRDEAAGRWRPPPPSGLLPLCSNGGLGVSPPSTQAAGSFCFDPSLPQATGSRRVNSGAADALLPRQVCCLASL